MLKEAIEKIEKMSAATVHQFNTKIFSDKPLSYVTNTKDLPKPIEIYGISSLVNLVKQEVNKLQIPIFIEVKNYNEIMAYSTFDSTFDRQSLYHSRADVPTFNFGWKQYDEAMISFRSQFKRTMDVDYILNLLSKITDENSISSTDNGLSQSIEVKKGVALKDREFVKPIVKLTPYRTFMEIEQPESEFLLRLGEGGRIGLFEADGGMWKLEAKKRIAEELQIRLEELINDGSAVVMY